MKMNYRVISLAVFLLGLAITVKAQDRKMKIYISADMEGVVGVVTDDQLGPQGFEYQRFREFMTEEVNAAISAAFEAGATDIVVSDSHGNGENLLIEKRFAVRRTNDRRTVLDDFSLFAPLVRVTPTY